MASRALLANLAASGTVAQQPATSKKARASYAQQDYRITLNLLRPNLLFKVNAEPLTRFGARHLQMSKPFQMGQGL